MSPTPSAPWLVIFGLACAISGCGDRADPTGGALDRLLGPSRESIPSGVDATYDAFVDACRRADAPSVWVLLGPDLKSQVDDRATQIRMESDATVLSQTFGHHGHRNGFDGTALLAALLRSDDERDPCRGAELWRRIEAGEAEAGGYYVVAQRPDGAEQGLRIEPQGSRWVIAELTRPMPRTPAS